MTSRDDTPLFALHRGGKIEVGSTVPLRDRDDLSLAYTPGVAEVCLAIADEPDLVNDYTWKNQRRRGRHRRDGGARPRRHRPGGVAAGHGGQGAAVQAVRRRRRGADRARDARTSTRSSRPSSGSRRASAASTSRTSARRAASRSRTGCKAALDIPVFHDDQHGTAIVALAALKNAARLTGRTLGDLRVVVVRRGRGRRRGLARSCSRPASATSRSPTARACSTRAAPT